MRLRKWLVAGLVLAVLVFLVGAYFWRTERPAQVVSKSQTDPRQSQQSGASQPANVSSATTPTKPTNTSSPSTSAGTTAVSASQKLVVADSGLDRSFSIAMDELVRKSPAGVEQSIPLQPQSSVAALRQAWSDLRRQGSDEIFPVVYEDGVVRSAQTRRLVTPKIRMELKEGEDLAEVIPGAVELTRPDYAPGFIVVRMPDSFAALDAIGKVRALGGVKHADVLLAHQQSRRTMPNDTLINSQWHLKNTGQSGGVAGTDIHAETIWNYPGSGNRGAGIVVGVVDDGLETTHPDLATNVRTDIDHDWNDATPDDPNPVSGDDNNHGTSCAGNVAAIGNNSLGVCGSAPESKVVSLRLIAASEGDQEESEAMAWDNNIIQIKSNSWGPNDDGQTLEGPGSLTKAALQTAATSGRGGLGAIFLWAGGNGGDVGDNSNYDGYANSIYTIAIGAISNKRTQSYYSESGANLVVVAPSNGDSTAGELDITTIDRTGTNGYNTAAGAAGNYATDFGGTSSATPTAAGVVALVLKANPNLGWRDVQEILIKTAVKVNPTDTDWTTNSGGFHFNHKFGAGLIDAAAAVAAAPSWTNLGAQTSAISTQSGLSVAIPNNNTTGITRTFNLSASNIRVEQVTVRMNINHTARGNLAITLTSPSGVASKLAEVHSDSGDNYADWTFMTVHDWGENSAGTWTLKIADLSSSNNSTGGTLTAAELTVFGTTAAATNPAPVVQMTSPQDQGSYSIGASINLTATASDLTLGGTAGVVTKVEFLSNGSVVGTVTGAPYTFNWTPPAAGNYTLSARATDSEGAVGNSGTVAITVANLPPTITAANVSPASQAFGDEALSLIGVVASDPEGTAVTLGYQWQTSTDGVNFTDAAGQTSATVAASASNTGRDWRCVITPSDGVNTGTLFTTASVMVVSRPAGSVTTGTSYSYASDLVLRGTTASFARAAIINEFSQGSGTSEWVEILTLQAGSFRKWKFDDATLDTSVVTFADSALWDNIPAGTRIVIYTGGSKDAQLSADDIDASDGKMVLASNNATYFSGTWPALGNNGDALVLKDSTGTVVHQISYGTNATITPNIGAVGSGKAAAFTGDTEAAAATTGGWRINSSSVAGSPSVVGVTPGEGNTTTNATFASNLRSGFFNQPALYRFGASSQTPTGLTISPDGLLSGTVTAAAGDYNVVIERYNSLSEVATLSFTLTVLPVGVTPTPTPTPVPTPTPTSTATPTPTPTKSVSPKILILKKSLLSGGKVLLVKGKSTGVGPIQVTAKIRKLSKTLKIAANATYTFRIKLYPGRNLVTLRATDAAGNKSVLIRIVVTK
ncbi:MAG: S8 family serine peptidase [Chthoniobacterales bacterium]